MPDDHRHLWDDAYHLVDDMLADVMDEAGADAVAYVSRAVACAIAERLTHVHGPSEAFGAMRWAVGPALLRLRNFREWVQ